MKKTPVLLTALVLALTGVCVAAERLSPVSAEARVLKSRVKIGDELRLLLQVEHPRKFSVTPPDEKLVLSPFEIKRVESVPVRRGQNRIQQTFRLTLTVFETGDLQVPAIPVGYRDEEGNPGEIRTAPVPVKVVSVGKKITDKDDIRPIKAPVSLGLLRFWTGLGGLLAGALFIFFAVHVVRRVLKERKDLESRKPPHERVKIELARLKDKGFLEEKDHKSFYSGLSDILRLYLERRYGVEALERTSSELAEELLKRSFDAGLAREIGELLSEADLVKFAKFAPPYEHAQKLEALLLDIVERTRPAPNEGKKG